MRSILMVCLLQISTGIFSQENFNMELVSSVEMDETSNDIWGYVDQEGKEYAIIGTKNSARVYSLEDPSNPQHKITISGTSSTWRDIKTYKTYAYVIADSGSDGLLIMNLTNPENITSNKIQAPFQGGQVQKCHNLYIDEEIGILFLAGCNTSGGILAFDLKQNPENPVFVSIISTNYAHDVFVQDNLVYASELNNGQLAIYNIDNIMDPQLLGSVKTSNFFTHNAWANEDNTAVFTTDEVTDGTIDSYDITDKSNPIKIDEFVPPAILGDGRVPHNTHFINDYLVTSWYSYGIVISDVSNPNKIIETAHYQTSGSAGADCWGAYPYLPSGLILGSDIANGLFVLQPTYERAAYLQGTIKDQDTGAPIINGKVKIISTVPTFSNSDPSGNYITGYKEEGQFTVEYDHPDYEKKALVITLSKGETLVQDVELIKSTKSQQIFKAVSASTNQELQDVDIRILNEELEYSIRTGIDGSANLTMVESDFTVIAGKWGFKYAVVDVNISGSGEYTIELQEGYEDDFLFDYGWTFQGPNARGMWTRVSPIRTTYNGWTSNPDSDVPDDLGNMCFVTGNGTGGAGQHDVDDGTFSLSTPMMDLSEAPNAMLSYSKWFFNEGGSGTIPNDSFKIFVTNQSEKILIETITENTIEWTDTPELKLGDIITLNDSIQVIFEATDDMEFGHLVEAGVDRFRVRLATALSVKDEIRNNELLSISPNPAVDGIHFSYPGDLRNVRVNIFSTDGKVVFQKSIPIMKANEYIYMQTPINDGIYVLVLSTKDEIISQQKFVKI